MQIGYARTSTSDQVAGLEAQQRDLAAAGCEKLFSEQVSSLDAERPALAAAIDFAREGDVLVVTKLDRLARSVASFVSLEAALRAKSVGLRVLAMNLDTTTPTGRLITGMMVQIAQFERELMLERQREGIAKAKAAGRYKGRKPTARALSTEISALTEKGATGPEIAKRLGISLRSVRRYQAGAGERAASERVIQS